MRILVQICKRLVSIISAAEANPAKIASSEAK